MDKDELKETWTRFKRDPTDTEMRNRLIDQYFWLLRVHAEKVASRFSSAVLDFDDLVSAGFFGMLQAFEAFDLNRGVRFDSFAGFRIRGAMLDELRRVDEVARLTRRRETKRKQVAAKLEAVFGRAPTDDEIAAELGFSSSEASKRMQAMSPPVHVSIDKEADFKDGRVVTFRELADREDRPDFRQVSVDQMRLITRSLGREERLLVLLYYYEGLTMKEIGRSIGVSESRVSQLHSQVVARLEEVLTSRRDELFERR